MKTMNYLTGLIIVLLLGFSSCTGGSKQYHACIPEFETFIGKVNQEYTDYTTVEWENTNKLFKEHLERMQKYNDELTHLDKVKIVGLAKSYMKLQINDRPTDDLEKMLNDLNP